MDKEDEARLEFRGFEATCTLTNQIFICTSSEASLSAVA